jgi:type VI secretion system secreted protein VgrG
MVSTTLLYQKSISLKIDIEYQHDEESTSSNSSPQDRQDVPSKPERRLGEQRKKTSIRGGAEERRQADRRSSSSQSSSSRNDDSARHLVLQEFHGIETISEPFEYTALMISDDPAINFSEMVGKAVTISIDCHDKHSSTTQTESTRQDFEDLSSQGKAPTTRYFNGVIGEFTQLHTAHKNDDNVTYYEAKIYPQFWMLKFTQDCRIFQNQSAIDIVKQILRENGVIDIEDKTKSCGRTPREYCVQYNENSFDFVSRLLEEEGIFYYFKHLHGQHTLVLGEATSDHEDCPGAKTADFEKAVAGVDYFNKLVTCKVLERVVPKSHALVDYNFTTASTKLSSLSNGTGLGGKVYAYPGLFDHEDLPKQAKMETISTIRIQADELPSKSIDATSTIPFFAPGFKFQMKGHTRKDVNKLYVLHTVIHEANITGGPGLHDNHYRNQFTAFPFSIPYKSRLKTPKPKIYSTQTARVTGPKNEEIWTDKYGRIKVRFHWDIQSKGTEVGKKGQSGDEVKDEQDQSENQNSQEGDNSKDEQDSSCWVRVAEGWAGNNWGILFTPRVGMEVVVTFLEGNPDRPLVIGTVYNSNNMPPYLPEQPTKSTIKSRSTKKGPDGFNELRFEDLKSSEEVFFHSQKDLTIRVNETVNDWIKRGSYWWWIDRGNREVVLAGEDDSVPKTTPKGQDLPAGIGDDNLTLLKGSRTMQLKSEQNANYNVLINHGDRFLEIEEGSNLELLNKGDYFIQQKEGNSDHFIEKGDATLTLEKGNLHTHLTEGNMTSHLTKGDHSLVISEGNDYKQLTNGDATFLVQSGLFFEEIKNNYTTIIDEGNLVLTVSQGTQAITVQGDQTVDLKANQTIKVAGNVEESITGNYTLKIDGNFEISVGGTVTIQSTGAATVKSDATVTIESGAEMTLNAGAAMTIAAAGDKNVSAASITITSEGTTTLESAGETTMNASEVNVVAETELTLEGTAGVTMSGAAVTIAGEATATMGGEASTQITGAAITLA